MLEGDRTNIKDLLNVYETVDYHFAWCSNNTAEFLVL